MSSHFAYAAKVQRTGVSGYKATFTRIGDTVAFANSREELEYQAMEALKTSLNRFIRERQLIPEGLPMRADENTIVVELPVTLTAKALLINTMITQHVRPSELADRMGTPRQEVSRILNFHQSTKIDTVVRALEVLGKTLTVSLETRI